MDPHHHHIYFPRITQKYNRSQTNRYNRKTAREAQNSLTDRLHREVWPTATADQRDAVLKRRFEDDVASMERSQYLRLHHRDLSFAQTVEKARIFHTMMDGGKAKKAVRFVGDIQEVMAARFTANHQPPQGYRRSSGQDEVREATDPEFDVAIYFDTSTTCTAWRPRGLPPNRQPPNNTGPHYGPPAPPASMPSAGSFQGPPRTFGPPRFFGTPRLPGPSGCSGPSGFRQPRLHLAECWECENRDCYSDFHQQNGTIPRSSGPVSPRLGFGNRGRR